jgi:hypothetical protein
MTRVLAAWNEHFVHADLPRWLSPRLREAGFTMGRRAAIPVFNTEYDPDSFSHGFTGLIAGFVAGRQGLSAEEAQAWADELRELGERGDYFFSLNRYLFVAEKPTART